jgi:Rad3-related DNA helicase
MSVEYGGPAARVSGSLRDHFPTGATPRAEQTRLLDQLDDALAEAEGDPTAPRLLALEAPPGIGKSHLAMTLARWSGDAYLLTSQKVLQDQYEREFGDQIQLVKGRDNYICERYADRSVPTSLGMCRRPRGPVCQCPYARAKAAALAGPVFCTNTWYFATLRHWHAEQLRRRRLLVIDEAHNLESQLVNVYTVRFTTAEMKDWFGAPLPHLPTPEDYRPLLAGHAGRMEDELRAVIGELEALRPPELDPELFLAMPPSPEEVALLARREGLEGALARLHFFVGAGDAEWVVRYPTEAGATFELVPLTVTEQTRELLTGAAELVVLSSAYLGPAAVLAESIGVETGAVRALSVPSPFPLEQRPIVYRPVAPLSRARQVEQEPALFAEIARILAAHPRDKGLLHVASYAVARRLVAALARAAPAEARRLIFVESSDAKWRALEQHRVSPLPTVLVSPSLREGVDLPDDFLRFQIITKMPYGDLGDPWTAARRERDPRWYALETAKALVQAYGRSCRHAEDFGVTYILDGQFARFLQHYRPLLPEWFLDAAHAALRVSPDW